MPKKLSKITNQEIADIFYEIADILEMLNTPFKPVAYRKAAQAIESLPGPLERYYHEETLDDIPSVGESITKKIKELLETGELSYLTKLKKKVPSGINKLMQIPGMGPKKISRLHKELNIRTLTDLKKAVKQKKIQQLKGFGEKSEHEIEEGIKLRQQSTERRLLGEIYPIANHIKHQLEQQKFVKKASLAGSVLRMKETAHDADILTTSNKPEKVTEFFTTLPEVKKILAKGSTKASVITRDNIQIDIRVVSPDKWGSALQYFTGSKDHGVATRRIAIEKGYKLSEYGLFRRKTNKLVESKSEKAIYKRLGMQWPPPELRETQGEIEAAQNNKLPRLVTIKDIQGDLHTHTNYTHGDNTIKEMVEAAKERKLKYISICDHSKSLKIAQGMSEKLIQKQFKEIDKLNKQTENIQILKSAEVDILKNGKLDYSEKILKQMDIVVAAIHSGFKKDNTKRLLKAMDNKYVNIIAHPTGRLINQRNPYPLNFEMIYEKAKQNKIALEINSQPLRLDLKPEYIRDAIQNRVKLVINTDAHSTNQLDYMIYGIAQARRGWAEKKDILNTLPLPKLLKYFKE